MTKEDFSPSRWFSSRLARYSAIAAMITTILAVLPAVEAAGLRWWVWKAEFVELDSEVNLLHRKLILSHLVDLELQIRDIERQIQTDPNNSTLRILLTQLRREYRDMDAKYTRLTKEEI